jgi:hypothetical protein
MKRALQRLLPLGVTTAAAVVLVLQASAGVAGNGNSLQATFNPSRFVSSTNGDGIVEVIVSGAGTVDGFGAATEVVGLIQDHAVTPCGAGSYSDTASRRISLTDGILVLHEGGETCQTDGTLEATATYVVDGRASTGVFAGARGTGSVTITGIGTPSQTETLTGKLKLATTAR